MGFSREKALLLVGRGSLAVLAAAALLGVAELVARATVPAPVSLLGRYPLVGVAATPGFKSERLSLDDPPQRFTFEIDPLGFRGKSMTTTSKPPGTYRVFFLGASTTENVYFPEERTFPGLVESALNERLKGSPRVEVANAGVAGATTAQVLDGLLHRVLHLAPDLVVVLEGHNELCYALDPSWDPRELGSPEPPPRFKDWLLGASRLFAALDDWSARRRTTDKHLWYRRHAEERQGKPTGPPAYDVLRAIPDFETALHRVALVCADAGVACAVMTQPSLYKDKLTPEESAALITSTNDPVIIDVATLKRALDGYNDAIRRVARVDRCRLVDLAAEVPGDLEHFLDDVHFTAKGNSAVADSVLRTILADGSLPRSGRPPR